MSWTIQPILTGWIHGYKGHFLTHGRGVTEKIDIPSLAWLLRGPGGPILVDTLANGDAMQYLWLYLVGPFAGGSIAAWVFPLMNPDKM